jgi:hypothetical protein
MHETEAVGRWLCEMGAGSIARSFLCPSRGDGGCRGGALAASPDRGSVYVQGAEQKRQEDAKKELAELMAAAKEAADAEKAATGAEDGAEEEELVVAEASDEAAVEAATEAAAAAEVRNATAACPSCAHGGWGLGIRVLGSVPLVRARCFAGCSCAGSARQFECCPKGVEAEMGSWRGSD